MWAKSPTQRTHVNDQSPSVTAATCPTGGAPGPCRGRSLDSPRGERVRSLDSPPRACACVHPHPHPRVCGCTAHVCTAECTHTPHVCTAHHGRTRGVHITCPSHSVCHIHHPRAHAAAQPRTRVFSSPPSARLSLPCAASSPGLLASAWGRGGPGGPALSPHLLGGRGGAGVPRVPGRLPSISAQGPRFPGFL